MRGSSVMTKLLKLSIVGLLVAAAALALSAVSTNIAAAHEGEDHEGEAVAQAEGEEERDEEEEESNTPYSYTAQSGDSYSKIARKAVQTYGVNNNVNLSGAEIVAAETFLTSDAGFPLLDLGQKVELSADAVKAAVEKAEGLDEAAEARWERYARFVDFNTDNVGEARE